jgi:hypothetical protein
MKRSTGTRAAPASMTMRPSAARKEQQQEQLAHLGVDRGNAPRAAKDPRIVAFETALAERRAKEKQMNEALQAMKADDSRKEALTKELSERREKERELQQELESLRRQLESRSEPEVDPYVAQLEAEISTLKFANLAQMEAFEEQKQLLVVAQEKAERLDATLERSERMEHFLNELQDERNSLAEQLEVAQQQLTGMAKLAGQAKPPDAGETEKLVAPFKKEIADLRLQLKARDDEIARQQEVMSQMRAAAEKVATRTVAATSVSASSPPAVHKTGAVAAVELDPAFKCLIDGSVEVFAKLVTAQMERNKERVSMLDKKVLRDPAGSSVRVLLVQRAADDRVVACAGLVQGAGAFDLKYVAFESEADSDRILGQLVLHASKFCVANGGDQLIALFSGARGDAEKKWGPHGFRFVGVGPAPDFMVRLAKPVAK